MLVTGYFSRSFRWDRPHLLSLLTTVALPYLVFEPALYYFRHALGQVDTGHLWLVPHWAMWYLPVLFMWRLATPVLRLHWVVLPVAVVLSLVGGLWSGQVLCFARVLGLLPFFVLGLQLSKRGLDWLDRPWIRRAAVAALLVIFVLSRFTDEWARTAFLYYDAGYDDLGYQTLPAMWIRLVVMVIGVVGALSAIALVPRSPRLVHRDGRRDDGRLPLPRLPAAPRRVAGLDDLGHRPPAGRPRADRRRRRWRSP